MKKNILIAAIGLFVGTASFATVQDNDKNCCKPKAECCKKAAACCK